MPAGETLEILVGEGFVLLLKFRAGDGKTGGPRDGDGIRARLAQRVRERGVLTDGFEEWV